MCWSWLRMMNLHVKSQKKCTPTSASSVQIWPSPAEPLSWFWPTFGNKGSARIRTENYKLTSAFLMRRLGTIFLPAALWPNFIMCLCNGLLRLHPAKHGFNNQHIKYRCWQGKGSWLQSIQELAVQQKYMIIVCSKSLSSPRPESSIGKLLESTGQGTKRN